MTRRPKSPNVGRQPDGNKVEEKADGQAFIYQQSLNANETFTSDWIDTDGWRTIEIVILATVQSKKDGVRVQFTDDVQADTPNVDAEITRTFANDAVDEGFQTFDFGTRLDGFRLIYENNSTPTTSDFTLVGTLRKFATPDSADYVQSNNTGDTFVTVGTDDATTGVEVSNPTSLFSDLQTITRQTIVDLTSSFGTSTIRDDVETTGSASIKEDPAASGEIRIGTGTTANSSISIQTAEYGRYTPGFSAQQGVGIRLPNLPTEGEAKWGYFDSSDGFYWGYDGDQEELFIARKKDGSEDERVYRSNFNRQDLEDTLNRSWSPTEGDIFQIDFSWYGYGIIIFTIVSQTGDDNLEGTPRQKSVPVHAINVTDESSISDPNQPIRVEVENGSNGEDIDVYIGGRQFSVFGQPPIERRITAATRDGVSVADGSWTYIMSFRRDPNRDPNSKLNIRDLTAFADGDARIALAINPNVSGTSYGNPDLIPDDETLLEVSKTGTFDGIGNGTKIWEDLINASGSGNTATGTLGGNIDARLGQDFELVLLAQGIGNSPSLTATKRMIEDW